jgi:hypothetical protein
MDSFKKSFLLEATKEGFAEFLPELLTACGNNLSRYIQGNVTLLSLLPSGSVGRALEGGLICESESDMAQMFASFPGLQSLPDDDIANLVEKLTKWLNDAPKYTSTILSLPTPDIVRVLFEITNERCPEIQITNQWVTMSIDHFKRELAMYGK